MYVKETLHQSGYPERFLIPQYSPSRKDKEKDDPKARVIIPYIQGISKGINVQVHMKPLTRILPHPKDHISDKDKSNIMYKINYGDCDMVKWGGALKTRVSEQLRA